MHRQGAFLRGLVGEYFGVGAKVQPHRFVEHYPPLRTGFAVAGVGLVGLCVVASVPVFVGGIAAWVLGVVDVALLGPIAALLIAGVRDDIRHDRAGTIRFSIDLEGVYDGQTQTLLPWSRVTAVKLIQPTKNEPPAGLVVVGVGQEPDDGPDDHAVDDRWEVPHTRPSRTTADTVAIFYSTYSLSQVRSAVRAFAPHIPIEHATAKQVRHLGAGRPART
jgi:hypothetical protein